MNILALTCIGIIFFIAQFLVLSKSKKAWIKWLPIEASIIGLLFCIVAYLNIFWTNSPSVIAENRYLALLLVVPFSISFIGCLLGVIIFKVLNRS